MEHELIEMAKQVFTLEWATWALPTSLILSMFVKRMLPALLMAVIAVAIHVVGPVALPALLGGEGMATIAQDVSALLPKLEPAKILVEFISYSFLIGVFSLTWRDMFRPYSPS